MIITIIGKGFVGKATGILENPLTTVWYYDVIPELCQPQFLTYEDINNKSDIVFICVPTPMNVDGSCDTTIVSKVLNNLSHPFVVIRSTVPIGFSEEKNCYFMPEFLTEKSWPNDFLNCPLWIYGIPSNSNNEIEFKNRITNLLDSAKEYGKIKSNEFYFCKCSEAEMIKLIRNNFLSTKVIFFNEIYNLCRKMNLDYESVRYGVGRDPRIGHSHTIVDGIEHSGYGGTCFPKDTNSLYHIYHLNDDHSNILEANLYANEYIYNFNKKWLNMYNRAITEFNGSIKVFVNISKSEKDNILKLLDDSNNIVIVLDETDKLEINNSRFFFKICDITHKLFIPKVNEIYYYINSDDSHTKQIKSLLNVLEFGNKYNIKTFVNSNNNSYIEELCNEYSNIIYLS
jgi:UDPglucose 6-dehydrogenase